MIWMPRKPKRALTQYETLVRELRTLGSKCISTKSDELFKTPVPLPETLCYEEVLAFLKAQPPKMDVANPSLLGAIYAIGFLATSEQQKKETVEVLIPRLEYGESVQTKRVFVDGLRLMGVTFLFAAVVEALGYWIFHVRGGLWGTKVVFPLMLFVSGRVIQRALVLGISAHHLGTLGQPEAIPVLCKVNRDENRSLYQLLPTLTPAHYRAFSKETVPNLCGILFDEIQQLSIYNLDKVRLLVEALEKIGDSRAILTVQRLQRELKNLVCPELQAKVANLLLLLEERKIQEEQHDTLLRGSSAPAVSQELLRPITGKPEQEPAEQLLRVRDIDKP